MPKYSDSLQRLFQSGAVWAADGGGAEEASSFLDAALIKNGVEPSHQIFMREGERRSSFAAPFCIPEIDDELADRGLGYGKVHEWFGQAGSKKRRRQQLDAFYPLTLLAVLIGNARAEKKELGSKLILWIGKECWPTPYLLQRAFCESSAACKESSNESSAAPASSLPSPLKNSLFVDLPEQEKRRWCFEQALRSPAVNAVVCSLKKPPLTITRRFAVAAKKGGTLGFLLRPAAERSLLSAAATRWEVCTTPSPTDTPRWSVTLLKQKGGHARITSWVLELFEDVHDEKISLHIPSDVGDKPGRTEEDEARGAA